MGGNEKLWKDHIGKALRSQLNMVDLVERLTGLPGPATFCRGKHQIDGVFETRDIECTGASFLPLRDGHGYHRSFLINVTYRSLIGKERLVVERPQAQII